jgi:hypothetical protein
LQRLEVVIAVMLARERRRHADTAAAGCTELASALAALESRPLEMVADAVVALDCAEEGASGESRESSEGREDVEDDEDDEEEDAADDDAASGHEGSQQRVPPS